MRRRNLSRSGAVQPAWKTGIRGSLGSTSWLRVCMWRGIHRANDSLTLHASWLFAAISFQHSLLDNPLCGHGTADDVQGVLHSSHNGSRPTFPLPALLRHSFSERSSRESNSTRMQHLQSHTVSVTLPPSLSLSTDSCNVFDLRRANPSVCLDADQRAHETGSSRFCANAHRQAQAAIFSKAKRLKQNMRNNLLYRGR